MKIETEIKNYGIEHKVPITLDDTLSFLIKIINENDFKQVLEIGTAIGYGCINIAKNTNVQHIDSVEIDAERFEIANQNISKNNLNSKITTHLIDAKDFLKNCHKKYDFIYLDGPKGQYINYLPYLIKILNKGGIIFADNLNFHGMVTGQIPVSKGCRAMIKGLKNYINAVTTSKELTTNMYKDIGDGVGVSRLT